VAFYSILGKDFFILGYKDVLFKADLDTCRHLKMENGMMCFIGDFVDDDGRPLHVCSRGILKEAIKRLRSLENLADAASASLVEDQSNSADRPSSSSTQVSAMCGVELEWFNFAETSKSAHQKGFNNLEMLTEGKLQPT
jgi:glutamine synthetase